MLGSLAYVVLISTKLISKITVKHISTILRLIFVDSNNPAQRKRCEFSKSYARVAMTTIHLISYSQSFCRTIASIRNFAKLQPQSNVNPLVFLISLWEPPTMAFSRVQLVSHSLLYIKIFVFYYMFLLSLVILL